MRTATITGAFVLANLAPAPALERLPASGLDLDLDRHGAWTSVGTTCSLAYYNTCTGWIWIWSPWLPNEELGVSFQDPDSPVNLVQNSWVHVSEAAHGGPSYGFVGTISIHEVDDDDCPVDPAIEEQPFEPVTGWNQYLWNAKVGSRWALKITMGPGKGNPMRFTTDHPAQGPTGPPACGSCYPTTRANHSWQWGTEEEPWCPGVRFNDGTCDAQLLMDCSYTCGEPVSVENSSWARIKGIYR